MTQAPLFVFTRPEPEVADNLIQLDVIGVPQPQGSKSGIIVNRGTPQEHVAIVEGKDAQGRMKHEAWRSAVSMACRQFLAQHPRAPISEPVGLIANFRLPLPQSAPHRTRHAVKPDIDKLLRSTLDALVIGGLLKDDSLVCESAITKRYARGDDTCGVWLCIDLQGDAEEQDRKRSLEAARRARRR